MATLNSVINIIQEGRHIFVDAGNVTSIERVNSENLFHAKSNEIIE